jgi:hypothetical protein
MKNQDASRVIRDEDRLDEATLPPPIFYVKTSCPSPSDLEKNEDKSKSSNPSSDHSSFPNYRHD